MSIGSVIVTPTPTAAPLTAAITGLRDATIRSDNEPAAVAGDAVDDTRSPPRAWPGRRENGAPPPRSAPAQNAAPAPVTMTARTPSSASAASNAATSSASSSG